MIHNAADFIIHSDTADTASVGAIDMLNMAAGDAKDEGDGTVTQLLSPGEMRHHNARLAKRMAALEKAFATTRVTHLVSPASPRVGSP